MSECPQLLGNMLNFLTPNCSRCNTICYEDKKHLAENASRLMDEYRASVYEKNKWNGQIFTIEGQSCADDLRFSKTS